MIALSCFFVKKKDSTYERVKKKRFDMKMKTLKNLIFMEEKDKEEREALKHSENSKRCLF